MSVPRKNGSTSNRERIFLVDSTTGLPKTGLTNASAGLILSTVADTEASGTAYSGANIQTIATIGTFAAPSAGKCRFGEVDATNHPGLYEVQLLDARYSISSATQLDLCVQATGIIAVHEQIPLVAYDPQDGVRYGLTSLPNNTFMADAVATMIEATAITGTLTSSSFTTNLASTTVNDFVGKEIRFRTGALANQISAITAYNGSGTVTVSPAFTAAPANNDTFTII